MPERAQRPREVGPGDDFVITRAALLQQSETLAHRTHDALRVPENDLEALDVAGHVPRGKLVIGSLRDEARLIEKTQRFARIILHCRGVPHVERGQVCARMRAGKLRRCGVKMDGAEDVENLHDYVVVATRLRVANRPLGMLDCARVIGTRQQYRDANPQRKRGVCKVAGLLQRLDLPIDDFIRGRIPALEVSELGAPDLHAKRQTRSNVRRQRRLFRRLELTMRGREIAAAHRAKRRDEMKLDNVAALERRRAFEKRRARRFGASAKVALAGAPPGRSGEVSADQMPGIGSLRWKYRKPRMTR